MADAQVQLQTLTDDYQKLQGELQRNVQARQRLEAQQQENMSVQKEFKDMSNTSKIYKLIGPVLLQQEHDEARMAVDGRLEYIGKEIERVEQQIKEIQDQTEVKKMEIIQIQSQQQQAQEQTAS